ncbi:hypothetical protein SVIOM342S_01102 [Streptomyces violaceorubidus]
MSDSDPVPGGRPGEVERATALTGELTGRGVHGVVRRVDTADRPGSTWTRPVPRPPRSPRRPGAGSRAAAAGSTIRC